MKIIVNPKFQRLTGFIKVIPEKFDREGEIIYRQRNELRVLSIDNELINAKRFRIPKILNRFVYSFFRLPKAERSFFHAEELMKKGIETPEPIAFIISKQCGLIGYSYYITKQVDYRHTMYEFGKDGITGREHVLKAFAVFTAKLHESGIYHCDYSPGNILYNEENGEVTFCIVDINRMKFGEISVKKGCANFARLWGQKPFFELVASTYAETRGADRQKCIEWVLQARDTFWKKHLKKHKLSFEL